MLNASRILVSLARHRLILAAAVLGALAGCGQKGPLYLPTDAAAAGRATLPQTLAPAPASSAPASGTANPIPSQ